MIKLAQVQLVSLDPQTDATTTKFDIDFGQCAACAEFNIGSDKL